MHHRTGDGSDHNLRFGGKANPSSPYSWNSNLKKNVKPHQRVQESLALPRDFPRASPSGNPLAKPGSPSLFDEAYITLIIIKDNEFY